MLLQSKVTDEYKSLILSQLESLQQKGTIQKYNAAFDKLVMQIPDLSLNIERHYYLKGLKQDIRQLVESNRENLQDMTTLKLACLRQDNILHLNQTTGNNKPRKVFEDSALISSTINSDRQNTRRRYNRVIFTGRGSFRGNTTNTFGKGTDYNRGRGFDNTRGRGISDRSRAFISRSRGNFREGYQNQNKYYIYREFSHTVEHYPAVRETVEKKEKERLQIKDHIESSISYIASTF